jgi:hypothetical protein
VDLKNSLILNVLISSIEDQAFFVKIYLASPVFAARECWTRYRMHPNSCMSRFLQDDEKHAASRSFFCDWFEQYLAERGIENEEIWAAIRALRRRRLRTQERPMVLKFLTRARQLISRLTGTDEAIDDGM